MNECVHVKIQEEVNIVLKHLNRGLNDHMISDYGECVIYLTVGGFDRITADTIKSRNYKVYSFEEWCEINNINQITNKQTSMIEQLKNVLSVTYDNPILRRTTVPLFMSNPGLGKSTIIKEFAASRGVKMVKMTLSTRMPNEVTGMTMPDLVKDRLVLLDSHQLTALEDGDVLFIDEVFNGTLKQTLDAFLNFLEDRMLLSGKKLSDVLIVAASNPQGLINITPQIKQRFIRYDLKFSPVEFEEYLKNKFGMPESISKNISIAINKEKFEQENWEYVTPRSMEKAINQIGCGLENPHDTLLMPFLTKEIEAPIDITALNVKKGENVEYLKLLKLFVEKNNRAIIESEAKAKLEAEGSDSNPQKEKSSKSASKKLVES